MYNPNFPTVSQNGGDSAARAAGFGDFSDYQNKKAANDRLSPEYQQQQYQQATQQAVGGLEQRQKDLPTQYSELLKTVTGEYQPLINQTTQTAGAELSRRGITPDSTLFQQQTQGALQPIYGAEAGNAQQLGVGSISDINTLAQNIAQLKVGAAGTASGLPLQYGSLALSAQALPSQIALAQARAAQGSTAANFITVPNVGVYNLATKQFVGGGAGASNQALSGVSGMFKYVP